MPKSAPAKPTLKAGPDALTEFDALTATVPGEPVSVWFAIRRNGGAWQKVAVDDSAPYRAFIDPLTLRQAREGRRGRRRARARRFRGRLAGRHLHAPPVAFASFRGGL